MERIGDISTMRLEGQADGFLASVSGQMDADFAYGLIHVFVYDRHIKEVARISVRVQVGGLPGIEIMSSTVSSKPGAYRLSGIAAFVTRRLRSEHARSREEHADYSRPERCIDMLRRTVTETPWPRSLSSMIVGEARRDEPGRAAGPPSVADSRSAVVV